MALAPSFAGSSSREISPDSEIARYAWRTATYAARHDILVIPSFSQLIVGQCELKGDRKPAAKNSTERNEDRLSSESSSKSLRALRGLRGGTSGSLLHG